MLRMSGVGNSSPPEPFTAGNSKPTPIKPTKKAATKKQPKPSGTKRSNARAVKKAK